MERLVEVDSERRVVLGALGNREDRLYLAHDEPEGTIVLTPAVAMPARQARFVADPERARMLSERDRTTLVEPDAELDELTRPGRKPRRGTAARRRA